jgi:hypothetical protein
LFCATDGISTAHSSFSALAISRISEQAWLNQAGKVNQVEMITGGDCTARWPASSAVQQKNILLQFEMIEVTFVDKEKIPHGMPCSFVSVRKRLNSLRTE